jgi:hypothetical protein
MSRREGGGGGTVRTRVPLQPTYLNILVPRTQFLVIVGIPLFFVFFLLAVRGRILDFFLLEKPLVEFGGFGPGLGSFHDEIVPVRERQRAVQQRKDV